MNNLHNQQSPETPSYTSEARTPWWLVAQFADIKESLIANNPFHKAIFRCEVGIRENGCFAVFWEAGAPFKFRRNETSYSVFMVDGYKGVHGWWLKSVYITDFGCTKNVEMGGGFEVPSAQKISEASRISEVPKRNELEWWILTLKSCERGILPKGVFHETKKKIFNANKSTPPPQYIQPLLQQTKSFRGVVLNEQRHW